MRIFFLLFCLFLFGCATHKVLLDVPYSGPFGAPPANDDLESIFLSLPDDLCAQMPVSGRRIFISDTLCDPTDNRFDPKNRYINYYSDSDDGTGATSMLFIKIFHLEQYKDVVFIHIPKPHADSSKPSSKYTYILIHSSGHWIDATDQLLPPEAKRSWYFLPLRHQEIVECGPYLVKERHDGRGTFFDHSEKKFNLVWKDDKFEAFPASDGYTYE